jgi:hypothetical protein
LEVVILKEKKTQPKYTKELQEFLDAQIQEWFSLAEFPLQPTEPGLSGSLGEDVFLPDDIVDSMEAAINEAFEQIAPLEEHDGIYSE